MKFTDPITDKQKIECLQRWIIVHSILYYELDNPLVSDMIFDGNCKHLVNLMAEYDDIKNTEYGYCMWDFDGSTGFDLYSRLNDHDKEYLMHIAKRLCLRRL